MKSRSPHQVDAVGLERLSDLKVGGRPLLFVPAECPVRANGFPVKPALSQPLKHPNKQADGFYLGQTALVRESSLCVREAEIELVLS